MKLEQLFHAMEFRLWNWGRRLANGPLAEVREAIQATATELVADRAELVQCRDELAQARLQLKTHETRAALLASHIQSYVYVHDGDRAFQNALELDTLRRQIAQDRQKLRRLLREERDLLEQARERHVQLASLEGRLATRRT